MVLVGEEDEHTRIVLQQLLQPTKQAQIVVAGLLCTRGIMGVVSGAHMLNRYTAVEGGTVRTEMLLKRITSVVVS